MTAKTHPRKNRSSKKTAGGNDSGGEVRIIGGQWRSRKIEFPGATGLRPTGDRIRETLFNWLQNEIVGSRCLDLFAGSGILGIEALSRGAESCAFVEAHPPTYQSLAQQLSKFDASQPKTQLIRDDAIKWLQSSQPLAQYNMVFVDPPFSLNIASQCCELLENSGLLMDSSLIYLEQARSQNELDLPASWQQLRSKSSGQVSYSLYRRETPDQTVETRAN
ncbi:MAG: 16S rRNA (guanine(966)-N(2))-methyltransferase RsmD [Pseudomonadales bacterium]|nr:16S rRNA (guanine(966)-N(2))-methyltransferase RsmD [Pseudomonadales bacterium]